MKIELLNFFGGDTMIVDVARVSFGKEAINYTDEQNARLINFLAKNKHTSPFRHPKLQFRIQVPLYVERQLFTHQIGWARNSISGRYVDFSDTYTPIKKWRKQSNDSKQGSEGEVFDQYYCKKIESDVIAYCKDAYERLLSAGVCKEQARTILPLNLNTTFYWTGSFEAFVHLCKLRLKPDAQQETRETVQEMLDLVKKIEYDPFKNSLKAFDL